MEQGLLVLGQDLAVMEQEQAEAAPAQVVLDQVEQGPFLEFLLEEVKDWGQENHLNLVKYCILILRNI